MRKNLKKKKRSCALCHPHKMGWQNRWNIQTLRRNEQDKDMLLGLAAL